MYTCNKKLHFSRTSVPDLISIKRPVVNGQITVQNWSISTTEEKAEIFKGMKTAVQDRAYDGPECDAIW